MTDRVLDAEARRPHDEVNGTASPPVPHSNGKSEERPTKINGDGARKSNGSAEAEKPSAVTIEAGGDDGGAGSTDPGTDDATPSTNSMGDRCRSAISKALGRAPGVARTVLGSDQINELRRRALEKKASDDAVSEELSITLGLAQRLRSGHCQIDSGYDRLHFIFDCLLADQPKLILARDERLRLQKELYQQAGPLSRALARISDGDPVALVLTALGASLFIWAVVFQLVRLISGLTQAPPIFFMDGKAFGITAFAALIGGIMSIATRLREFSRVRDLDPFAMFWTALLKPLVGVMLAMFVVATLAGDVVSLGFLGADPLGLKGGAPAVAPKNCYILWVLGFLAGFSERFAWDFVDRAQGAASGSSGGSTARL